MLSFLLAESAFVLVAVVFSDVVPNVSSEYRLLWPFLEVLERLYFSEALSWLMSCLLRSVSSLELLTADVMLW